MIDGGRFDRADNSNFFKKLKSRSIFFSNTITYGPHTIASMHAVFSGCYGNRTGTNSYWSTYNFKKDQFKTLTEYLKENNFYTHADVINQLVVPKQGFDTYNVHDEINDDLIQKHKKILDSMKKKNNNFFLYLHYSKIHTGIMNEVLKIYDNFSNEFFSNKHQNNLRYDNLFKAAENYLDEILTYSDELGLLKNSIILIMSDHGISIGEKVGERAYGAFCYDYTLRTFTYLLVPEYSPVEITQQIRTIDIMPTILELLSIPLDKNYNTLDGLSLIPLVNGESMLEQYAFSETGNPLKSKAPPKEPNVKSIRTSKWKLIFNEYDGSKELYDLESDPDELKNIFGKGLEIEKILSAELELHINQNII